MSTHFLLGSGEGFNFQKYQQKNGNIRTHIIQTNVKCSTEASKDFIWLVSTHLKNMLVKLDLARGKSKKHLKPPTSHELLAMFSSFFCSMFIIFVDSASTILVQHLAYDP